MCVVLYHIYVLYIVIQSCRPAHPDSTRKYIFLGNLCGFPGISIPVGYDEGTSIPIGLHILGAGGTTHGARWACGLEIRDQYRAIKIYIYIYIYIHIHIHIHIHMI